MNYNRYWNIQQFVSLAAGLYCFYFIFHRGYLEFHGGAEIELIALAYFLVFFFSSRLSKRSAFVTWTLPAYMLAIMIFGIFSAVPVSIGYAAFFLYRIIRAGPLPVMFVLGAFFRQVPALLIGAILYEKTGGGFAAFVIVSVFLTAFEYLTMNVFLALREGKLPWVPIISGWEFATNIFFAPMAIPGYFLYQRHGVEGLSLWVFLFSGFLYLVKHFSQEAGRKERAFDNLLMAGQLVGTALDFDKMGETIVKGIHEAFFAKRVDVFVKEDVGWKLTASTEADPGKNFGDLDAWAAGLWRFSGGTPRSVVDASSNPLFAPYSAEHLAGLLIIPVYSVSRKEPESLIICSHDTPYFFLESHVEMGGVLSGQLTNAFYAAKLHRGLQGSLADLRAAQGRLVQAERAAGLGKLVAGVAHELNNPLNFISMRLPAVEEKIAKSMELLAVYQAVGNLAPVAARQPLSLMENDFPSNGASAYFASAFSQFREATTRSRNIVEGLRTFARAETVGENKSYVDIHEALDATLALAGSSAAGISIEKSYGAVSKVWCSPAEMNQVLMSVLTNAFEAVNGNGAVRIETIGSGDCVTVLIKDNGCGISKEDLPRVFEPFFTTKTGNQGAGLGLSSSREIVTRQGGTIEIDSEKGNGTAVTLTLPVEPGQISREP